MKKTWDQVKFAVNCIYERHNSKMKGTDFVRDICNNALPHAMVQVLAMDCVENVRDEYTETVINGYKQLQEDGGIID